MDDKPRSLTALLQLLRWFIPMLMALFGAGYPAIDHLLIQQHTFLDIHTVRESLILGSVGPLLLWVSLTWLKRAIAAREEVEKTLAYRNQELSAVNAVARTAGASLKLQTILDDALDQILVVTGVEVGEIFLLAKEEQAMIMAAQRGILVETFREIERFPLGEGFPGRVAVTGHPLVTTDLAHDLRYLRRQVVEAGFGSYACVPVQAKGRVVGTLGVAALGQRQFSSYDLELLTAIGLQLGLAIENAHLFAAERTQRELADTLRRVSRSLSASLNLDNLLKDILHQLGRVLIVDAGLILLAEGNRLTVAASRGRPELTLEHLVGYTFDAGESPYLAQVLREKQPGIFCDPERADVFSDGIGRIEDVQWCLVVPLLHGREAIGLLTPEQVGHCYDQEEEAQIAFAFANHAAVAIANAHLFADSQKVAMLEERDRVARDMHDGLVQTLSFLNMKLDTTQAHLNANQTEQAKADLNRMRQVVGQAYENLRDLIVGLKKTEQPDTTLPDLLRERLAVLLPNGEVDIQLVIAPAWRDNLPPGAVIQVADIIQEALTNVYKHAQARRAWVRLEQNGNEARIIVEDDGRGFAPAQIPSTEDNGEHWGLTIMRERAESIGGRLTITERPRDFTNCGTSRQKG
ncbi:MAG: GAF domain-containing protein [Anaerolineae bacterium]